MSIIKNIVSLQDHHLTWQRGYQEPEHEKFQELIKNKKFSTSTKPNSTYSNRPHCRHQQQHSQQ